MMLTALALTAAVQAYAPPDTSRFIKPTSSPTRWVTQADLRKARVPLPPQRVVIGLSVDLRGIADGCRIMESSGSADADAVICAAAQRRARFAPALDANGRPKRSSFNQAFSFR